MNDFDNDIDEITKQAFEIMWKGIIQIEQTNGDFSYGFLHSSKMKDGLEKGEDDQNIIYIKKSFNLK